MKKYLHLQQQAFAGDAQAQRDVGALYAWGSEGFPQDDVQAREWFARAAAQGHPQAEYDLANYELFGRGGQQDILQGIELLKQSASHTEWNPSSEQAAYRLSRIYAEGTFEQEIDGDESEHWKRVWHHQKHKKRQWKRKKWAKYGKRLLVIGLVCLFWWKIVRFPPQIFGTPKDHFRAHVIKPIPASVSNLQVALDDLIIHPDVTYWFRFNIEPHDLEKIITYRSLQRVSDASRGSYPPSWWGVEDLNNPEIYAYRSSRLYLALWWNASEKEAYYLFVTF